MTHYRIAIGLAAALMELSGVQAQTPPRTEVPIREVVLSDGERRYAIPIKVGSVAIEAGLDTGSTGLRVLPNALGDSDAMAGAKHDSEAYGAGTQFDGVVGTGNVGIGALSSAITMQLVGHVGCMRTRPDCPASRIPLSKFGVLGSGLPGEGFRAIIRVNMAEADVPNPLKAIGATRWIVELPRPGETAPGKLILNPTDDEVKDFAILPILATFSGQQGGLHDAVAGCILNATTRAKACGALMLDSGAPGIRIINSHLSDSDLQSGASGLLAFYDGSKLRAVEQFIAASRAQATHIEFDTTPRPPLTAIYAGLTPYFAFDVLYDPARDMIGLRPRAPAQDGPRGELAP
ncbi:MAG TPA: hypothetical protein VIJ72_05315 [Rhizomicrobium sp.]